jgi:hypothetical protein
MLSDSMSGPGRRGRGETRGDSLSGLNVVGGQGLQKYQFQ